MGTSRQKVMGNNPAAAFLKMAQDGNLDGVKDFIEKKGDLMDPKQTPKDGEGQTALHLASGGGHIEVVKFIVQEVRKKGGKEAMVEFINIKNKKGMGAYGVAATSKHVGCRQVCQFLNMNGADDRMESAFG